MLQLSVCLLAIAACVTRNMNDNKRAVALSAQAQEDLLDIWHYSANSGRQNKPIDNLGEMFERLSDNPNWSHLRDDLIAGLRSVVVHPHLIFYRRSSGAIHIVRILHQRLDTSMHFRQ
ncbi:type II toxin-antitoxin system RelE/ParE family toxin [Bradyrhizobium sp. B097]|uniref:type II toxin-antitoxin system RelE/ParE family toxin n=1 Tax=Bradyrhizobium sp. B097 TaxID=3140244 RepID=UPI003182D067